MKPPLEGGAIPSGQMRSLVSPWPSSGAAAPQSAHAYSHRERRLRPNAQAMMGQQ